MSLRARLLAVLAEPLTAKAAAERLAAPVGRLYHHLDRLLAEGHIRVVAEQRRRAVLERTFQAVAPPDARATLEALLAACPQPTVATARVRLTPERLRLLQKRLPELLATLATADGAETEIVLVAAQQA